MTAGAVHGGNVHAVARERGRRLDRLVDFSASINPLGPSPDVLQAIKAGLPLIVHYPDPDCVTLRQALADRWRLSPDRFLIGNGSSELIYYVPRALSIRRALIVGPTFSEYERAVAAAGGRATYVHAKRGEQYRPPLEKVTRAIQETRKKPDALFLCNPNSPTGAGIQTEQILRLAGVCSRRGIWLIMDETFVEYCEAATVLPQVVRLPRLLVLRSFTKFYALPGLRIGYLVGSPDVLAHLKALLPPWSVNHLAQTAALAGLKDRGHAARSLAYMERERPRLARSLQTLPGVTVFSSSANFLLIELPPALPAAVCAKALREQDLLIRDCSSVPGLNRRAVRVAVRTPGQNRRLVTVLRHVLGRCQR